MTCKLHSIDAQMGLQKHIAQETALHVSDPLCMYVPLALPISEPSATHRRFGFSNLAVKMLLFSIAIHLNSEDVVVNQAEAKASLRCIAPYQHILEKCNKHAGTCTPSIPLYIIRWFASIFEAASVWRSQRTCAVGSIYPSTLIGESWSLWEVEPYTVGCGKIGVRGWFQKSMYLCSFL